MNKQEKKLLDNPPYLQLAVDIPNREQVQQVLEQISSAITSQLGLSLYS